MNAKKKDKVPFNYLEALNKVMTVFLYQTVYNPTTKQQTTLSKLPEGEVIDQEYIGPLIDQNILPDYVRGLMNKSTMEKRQTYGGVIDFKILLDDFRTNNITDRSFKCIDDQFFGSTRPREERKTGEQ